MVYLQKCSDRYGTTIDSEPIPRDFTIRIHWLGFEASSRTKLRPAAAFPCELFRLSNINIVIFLWGRIWDGEEGIGRVQCYC